MSGFNDTIISEFRANGGHVETAGFGDSLVLLHTVGARSGEPRINPLMAIRDGEAWLLIASAAGSPRHPAWYFNLRAEPNAAIEVGTGEGTAIVDVATTELEGAEYDRAWRAFTSRSRAFEQYEQRAEGRVMPILRLAPRA